ncbi:hypothetical protein NC651_016036 [Populus alba x Populus x berolinensis]|nr:hypothetical protein NC651_016036 [Populus alba x Populus x berolinensis]
MTPRKYATTHSSPLFMNFAFLLRIMRPTRISC